MGNSVLEHHHTFSSPLKILWLPLIFICLPNPAFSQVRGGTIVVMFYSPDKVIFAADSRLTIRGINARTRDDDCKLLALNKSVIVATGGDLVGLDVGYADIGANASRNMAQVLAKNEASKIGPTVVDPAKILATAWLEKMVPFVKNVVTNLDPAIREQLLAKRQLTHGLFAGIAPDGDVTLYWSIVEWDGSDIRGSSKPMVYNPSVPFLAYGSTKGMTVFVELVNTNVSPSIHPEWKDRDIAKTIYLAEKVRDTAHDPAIAGPIDVAELRRGSTINWIQRKPNCTD
jgi:hypothetical protein